MITCYYFRVVFSCSLLSCLSISPVLGQLARKAQEVWPSVDTYYKLNDKLRLYGTMAGTKKDSTNYTDGSMGLFLDVFAFPVLAKIRGAHLEELPGKYFRLRAGYQYSGSPPSSEDPFRENLFVSQFDGRPVLPFSILLTLRNRFDFRFKEEISVPDIDLVLCWKETFIRSTSFLRFQLFWNIMQTLAKQTSIASGIS